MAHQRFCIFILTLILTSPARSLEIPTKLTSSDRKSVLEILGFGTAMKSASNPYPLGGYEGFEFGITSEIINIEDLSRLGQKTDPQPDLNVSSLMVGKGLYQDIDVFLGFIPISSSTKISNFGAQARWKFFEAQFVPVTMSILIHANSANFQNKVVTNIFGADLIGAINVDSLALYVGAGPAKGTAQYSGGVTNTGNTQTEKATTVHSFAGITYNFTPVFISFEMDRYTQPIYAARLGFRF